MLTESETPDVHDAVSTSESGMLDMTPATAVDIPGIQELIDAAQQVLAAVGEHAAHGDILEPDHVVEAPVLSGITEQLREASEINTLPMVDLIEKSEDASAGVQHTGVVDSSALAEEGAAESQEMAQSVSETEIVTASQTPQAANAGRSDALACAESLVDSAESVGNFVEPENGASGKFEDRAAPQEHAKTELQLMFPGEPDAVPVVQLAVNADAEATVQASDEIPAGGADIDTSPSAAMSSIHEAVSHEDIGAVDHSEDVVAAEGEPMPAPEDTVVAEATEQVSAEHGEEPEWSPEEADAAVEPTDARRAHDVGKEQTSLSRISLEGIKEHDAPDVWWAQHACALGLASGGLSFAPAAHETPVLDSAGEMQILAVASMGSPSSLSESRVENTTQWATRQTLGAFNSVAGKRAAHAPVPALMPLQRTARSPLSQEQSAKASLGAKTCFVGHTTDLASSPEVLLQAHAPESTDSSTEHAWPSAVIGIFPVQDAAAAPAHFPDLVQADQKRHASRVRSALPCSYQVCV